jgi:hypothetical protein
MKFRISFNTVIIFSLFFIFTSCTKVGFYEKLPNQLPFLYLHKGKNTELLWHKAILDLNDGKIIESDRPVLVQNRLGSVFKLSWDGHHTFFVYSQKNEVQLFPVDENDTSVFLQAPDSSPYYVFNASKPDQQVLVYLPMQVSRRNEVVVEIFGKKAQKLTLRMPSADYPGLRILRPLAIASTKEGWTFYFQTIENNAEKTSLGIIASTYDYSEIKWSVVSRQVPFNEVGLTSSVCYYKNSLYLSTQEGEVWNIHPKNGKLRKHELLTKEIKAFVTQLALPHEGFGSPEFYTYEGYLIVQTQTNKESFQLLFDGSKVKASIKTLQDEAVFFRTPNLLL